MRLQIRNHPVRLFFTLLCSFLLIEGAIANSEAENLYNSGLVHFEGQKYNVAIEKLENAIKLEPKNAAYHQLLAKSYGREAENANWFRAMSLAKKTLTHLKVAEKLDSYNVDILDDLMDYYREAPGFLGGDTKKANEIEGLIEKISSKGHISAKFE
jgi:tetratricopeptide (TPR) repeat protein